MTRTYYFIKEEACGAIVEINDDLQNAIEHAKGKPGKYLVVDISGKVYFDSEPNVTYKF